MVEVKGYTLTFSKEQQRITSITNCLKCMASYLNTTKPDAMGNVIPFIDRCAICSSKSFARKVKRVIEEEINNNGN